MAETISQMRARMRAEREAAQNAPVQDAARAGLFHKAKAVGDTHPAPTPSATPSGIIAGDVRPDFKPPTWLVILHKYWHVGLALMMFVTGLLYYTVPELVPGAQTGGSPKPITGLVAATMGGLMVWGILAFFRATIRNAASVSDLRNFSAPYWIIAISIFSFTLYQAFTPGPIESVLFDMMTEEAQLESLRVTPRDIIWNVTKSLALAMIGARILTAIFFKKKA